MRVDVLMPQMGESITEGTVNKWLKTLGDRVNRDEPLLEISTDKVDAEIPSPAEGTVAEILCQPGETVPINTVIAVIETQEAGVATPPPSRARSDQPEAVSPVPARPVERDRPPARSESDSLPRSSPLVRRLAHEHNIDLRLVEGTGLSGRVTKGDVLRYLESRQSPALGAPPPHIAEHRAGAPAEGVTIQPMSPMRKMIAERMIQSRRTSAHVTTLFEIDMTRVARARESMKGQFARQYQVKLTYMSFIAQACVEALKAFPILNSMVDGDTIVTRAEVNLGFAVALDWGLIVPVLKRADEKSLLGIARGIQDLAERAREKRLSPEDVQGGTFTISNPGVFGSLFGTPIINQPQVAILGVGQIAKRVVVTDDDAMAIRSMAYFALSFDHRLIDGAIADQFMSLVKRRLENWTETATAEIHTRE